MVESNNDMHADTRFLICCLQDPSNELNTAWTKFDRMDQIEPGIAISVLFDLIETDIDEARIFYNLLPSKIKTIGQHLILLKQIQFGL